MTDFHPSIQRIIWICFPICLLISGMVFAGDPKCSVEIYNKDNQIVVLEALIADTDQTRAKGLMERKSLEWNTGMLFIFPEDKSLNFWMQNTYVPLSIAYIDRHGRITEILDMTPLDTSTTYPSKYRNTYALEVNKGWFSENNITVGCKLKLNACTRIEN